MSKMSEERKTNGPIPGSKSRVPLSAGLYFFFSSRRRHTRCGRDWSSDVCSSDLVLGIETTCDETAAAVVERHDDGPGTILSNVVLSQIAEHAAFGGVVPEIAARAHVEALDLVIATAMADAGRDFSTLDGIAAAAGPGLIGGVIVGLTT